MKAVLGVIVIIAVFILIAVLVGQHREDQIREWAAEHRYTVVDIDQCIVDHGPYSFWEVDDEDDTIYKVVLRNEAGYDRVAYFKFGWSMEHRWAEKD